MILAQESKLKIPRMSASLALERLWVWTIPLFAGAFAIVCTGFYSVLTLGRFSPDEAPFEDAAMLFRYAEIFAQGGGIAYNYGEHPGVSDGATDLGFVLALAPLIALGLDSTLAAFLLNCFGVFGTGCLFGIAFVVSRVSFTLRNFVFLGGAILFVMSGPVHNYLAAGFSPPVFGFLLASTALLGFVLGRTAPNSLRLGAAVGLIAGLCGIWRPEGFFFGPFFALIGYIVGTMVAEKLNLRKFSRDLLPVLIPFFSILVAYLAFRFLYFGRIFPTSAVNKTSSQFSLSNAETSLAFVGSLTSLFIVLVLLAATRRPSVAWPLVATLVVTSLFWMPFSLTLNHWMRFQWPLVPAIALMAFSAFLPTLRKESPAPSGPWQRGAASLSLFSLFALLALASHEAMTWSYGQYFEAPYQLQVSEALRPVDTRDLRLATSEAGMIPLRFEGEVLDTYGHNHRQIAEDSSSLGTVLRDFEPNILVLHGPNPAEVTQEGCSVPPFSADWLQMTSALSGYTREAEMELFRVDQTGLCNSWIIYLDKNVPAGVRSSLTEFSPVGETTWLDQRHN